MQRASYHHPDLHHEEVLEVDSPFASAVASGTHVFTFLVMGDQVRASQRSIECVWAGRDKGGLIDAARGDACAERGQVHVLARLLVQRRAALARALVVPADRLLHLPERTFPPARLADPAPRRAAVRAPSPSPSPSPSHTVSLAYARTHGARRR
jgi:hypothetical protein